MNAKLTDDAVAALPLSHGRADLLEEIMSTPVLDDRPVRTERPRRRTTWVVPAAAAAVVAVLALGTAWWVSGPGSDPTQGIASQPTVGVTGDRVVLDAPGWAVTSAYADQDGGEVEYQNGELSFTIAWYPSDQYESFVEDRRHITEPPAAGKPIAVLGLGAQMWAYSAENHTAIREVERGHSFEFRGSGMDRAAYLALLDRLRPVDLAGFEAAMPASFVDGSERQASIEQMLSEIHLYVDPLFPASSNRTGVSSDQTDPYQLGAEVAGAVACAWLDEFAEAKQAGNEPRADRAAEVLATSRSWPVLKQMDASGDYPEVLWDYADQVNAGQVPDGYRQGLGCEG